MKAMKKEMMMNRITSELGLEGLKDDRIMSREKNAKDKAAVKK